MTKQILITMFIVGMLLWAYSLYGTYDMHKNDVQDNAAFEKKLGIETGKVKPGGMCRRQGECSDNMFCIDGRCGNDFGGGK
jgi:hypothetical protein